MVKFCGGQLKRYSILSILIDNALMGEKVSVFQLQHSASREDGKDVSLSHPTRAHCFLYISAFFFYPFRQGTISTISTIQFIKALSLFSCLLSSWSRHYLNPELFVLLSCSLSHPVSSRVHISVKTAGINLKVTI